MWIRRGSYTIEASILIPFYIFILANVMNRGIMLYGEMQKSIEGKDFWAVEAFYTSKWLNGEQMNEGE